MAIGVLVGLELEALWLLGRPARMVLVVAVAAGEVAPMSKGGMMPTMERVGLEEEAETQTDKEVSHAEQEHP